MKNSTAATKFVRDLTPAETCAMYHFHDRYAGQMAGAIEFFQRLPPAEQDYMREMARAIIAAGKRDRSRK